MSDNSPNSLKHILDKYPIIPTRITLETWKDKKAVWWINTANQKFVLKKLSVGKSRLQFLLKAIEHLRRGGIHIPEICQTSTGSLFVEEGEALYLMMEAVPGRPPDYFKADELAIIMEGMAAFHRASGGFSFSSGCGQREHLGGWEKKYSQCISDLKKFRNMAANSSRAPFEVLYLAHCNDFIAEGSRCLDALKKPAYKNWVEKVRRETNLCHQDFAAGNLGLVNGTLYVYDLDSVTLDLPARDLRKILNKVMKKKGGWDLKLTTEMLKSYQKINPLSREENEVLFVDIRFPHLFYGICSKYFENREKEWSSAKFLRRLEEMTKVEKSKEIIIKNQEKIISCLF